MLVLSRKEGQTILIGDGIEIQIAAVQGSRVRIAINAPRDIRVLRGEIAAELETARCTAAADASVPTPVVHHCV